MDLSITRLEEVWTADNQKLGLTEAIYYRLEGANPELRLYASYLHVQNFEYGDDYYIPTDFIQGREPETGRLILITKFITILQNTWTRMPDFVLQGQGRLEKLHE